MGDERKSINDITENDVDKLQDIEQMRKIIKSQLTVINALKRRIELQDENNRLLKGDLLERRGMEDAGKDGKHIHFDWDKNFDVFEEIYDYGGKYHYKGFTHEGLSFAEGKIVGCNEERDLVFRGFIMVAFEAGIMYGMKNKDKIKLRECSDSECSERNIKDNTTGLYV